MILHHLPANRPMIEGWPPVAARARIGIIVLASIVAMLAMLNLAVLPA